MGFFKSLKNTIGRGIGKALEKIGEVTNILSLELAGMDLQDACSEVSESIGEEEAFSSEEARAEDTSRINAVLTEFTLSLEKKADIIEKSIIEDTNKYLEAIINELKKSDVNIDINTDRINDTRKKVEELINGNIKKHISKRISIDDDECSKILQMESGKLKKTSMQNFSKSVLKEAISLYAKNIQQLIQEQNKGLKDTIMGKLEDLKINTEKHIAALEEFERTKGDNQELEDLIQNCYDNIILCEKCEEYLV